MPSPTEPTRLPQPGTLTGGAWQAAGSVALLMLAACVQPPTALPPVDVAVPVAAEPTPAPREVTVLPTQPPAPDPVDLAARRLLAFNDALRGLSAADLTREQARLAVGDSADDTLALAWLLGQSRQPGDLARALNLLDPLLRSESSHAALARLLHARLSEQRRVEEQAERLAQQVREQQRRLDQLNQQLESLRAIERSLGTRLPPSSQRLP